MIDWTFTFISVEDKQNPEIILIVSFKDGSINFISSPSIKPDIIKQMEQMLGLISYMAIFPEKDIIKIELETKREDQYACHYLEKNFLKDNFLGVFSISEYEEVSYKLWGVEEMMSNYFFDYFLDWAKLETNGVWPNIKENNFKEFKSWLSNQIKDFYLDWLEARENAIMTNQLRLSESTLLTNGKSAKTGDSNNKNYERSWDIIIINEYGLPVTNQLQFIDDECFLIMADDESSRQNLNAMSLSALKTVINRQGGDWNIKYIKSRLANNMGHGYTFFRTVHIKDITYILVMNSMLFSQKESKFVQMFKGIEYPLLYKIGKSLKLMGNLFSEQGQLLNFTKDIKTLEDLIKTSVDELD